MRRTALSLCLLAAAACQRTNKLSLPEETKGDVAFGALYAGDSAVVVGPVVSRGLLRGGGYVLEAEDGELVARLYALEVEALVSTALTACGRLEGSEAAACDARVEACRRDPVPCLAVDAEARTCGARLELGGPPELEAYTADAQGKLQLDPGARALAADLHYCGPELHPGCPLRLPGFTVFEEGRFRCTAPAQQLGCELSLELNACALGELAGVLDAGGRLDARTLPQGCTVSRSEPTEVALSCDGRDLVLRFMEVYLGEVECPRRGPSLFNSGSEVNGPGAPQVPGSISGLASIHPAGWQPRLLLLGTGVDMCIYHGSCGPMPNGYPCDSHCTEACNEHRYLDACREPNRWAPCVGAREEDDCVARCEPVCKTERNQRCEDSHGYSLALVDPAFPEHEVARFDLDSKVVEATQGTQALVVLGDPAQPVIAGVGTSDVFALSTGPVNAFLESSFRKAVLPGMVARGLLARSDSELLVFGRTTTQPSAGLLRRVSLSGTVPTLGDSAQLPALRSVDAAALSPDRAVLYAVSLISGTGAATRRLEAAFMDGSAAGGLDLPARPTALGPLAGRAAAVGVLSEALSPSVLVVVMEGDAPRVAATLPLPPGLVASAFLPEPCAGAGECRVFVGLVRTESSETGSTVLGLITVDPRRPESARLVESYLPLPAPNLSMLTLEPEAQRLVAASSPTNELAFVRVGR